MINGGESYNQVYRSLVNSSDDPSDSHLTPKKKQIRYLGTQLHSSKLKQISEFMYVRTYVAPLEDNIITIIIPKKIHQLLTNTLLKSNLFVDSTHEMLKDKHTLTTLLFDLEGVSTPVAWMVHSHKTEEDYLIGFNEIKKYYTEQVLEPMVIYTDFEKALRNALAKTFHVPPKGDFFHFMQANVHWLLKNKLKEFIPAVVETLKILFTSPTVIEFNSNYEEFKLYFQGKCDPYLEYFKHT